MKRFLSIMLCVMMLVSVFSIGASAMVPTSYTNIISDALPEDVIINQDFSDEENLEFTAGYDNNLYGEPTVIDEPGNATNKILQFVGTGNSATERNMLLAETQNTVLSETDRKMTVEFKVYPVGQAETISVGGCMPTILAGTDDADGVARENYYIIYYNNFKADQWNTVKVEFDVPANYSVSNKSYPAYGNADTATITVNGKVLTCVPGSAGKNAAEGKYTVQANYMGGSTMSLERELTYIALNTTIATCNNTTIPEGGRKVYFDDIKVYKPAVDAVTETINYPINTGNILHTETAEIKVSAEDCGFNGATNASTLAYKKDFSSAYASKTVLTFDAKVVTAGYAFCMTVMNGESGTGKYKVNIFPTEEIGNDWYTYRVETGYDAEHPAFKDIKVYRRKAGTNDAFVLLHNAQMKNGGDYCTNAGNTTGYGSKHIQVGYWYHSYALGTFTVEQAKKAEWTMRNLQLIEVDEENGAVTGKATAKGDGTADVKLFYTTKPGATTPIVAVYDGTKLVDIEYAAEAINGEGEFNANVDYVAGNTVKLFIWNGIATGVPVLNAAVPITVQ